MFEHILAGMPQFLAAYAVVLVTPGPITFATGSLATLSGLPRAMPFVIGIGTGAASLTAFLGLMADNVSTTVPLPILHLAGTALLIWIAVRIIRIPLPAGEPVKKLERLAWWPRLNWISDSVVLPARRPFSDGNVHRPGAVATRIRDGRLDRGGSRRGQSRLVHASGHRLRPPVGLAPSDPHRRSGPPYVPGNVVSVVCPRFWVMRNGSRLEICAAPCAAKEASLLSAGQLKRQGPPISAIGGSQLNEFAKAMISNRRFGQDHGQARMWNFIPFFWNKSAGKTLFG
ncbi:LysE family translocator [Mesorhizobium temperatum]|nr:hypothetical protein [Mesorhizobium temperatum]